MDARHGSALVAAVVVALVGLVFVAQGFGAPIGRSFMIGDLRWTAIGLVMISGAALYAWRTRRRSS